MATPAQIRESALALSEQERAELACELIRSLDGAPDPDAGDRWIDVVTRRAREVRDGTVDLIAGESALKRVRARLKERTE